VLAQLRDVFGTQIGEFMMLPVTPQIFSRIQLGCVGGRKLQLQPTVLTCYKVAYPLTPMRCRSIPDYQDLAGDVPQQVRQELHPFGTAYRPRKQPETEVPPSHSRLCDL
jgi:hypothetical protein